MITALISAIIGSIIGPILFREYSAWKQSRKWEAPRKELLKKMLQDEGNRFKSIDRLSLVIGCSPEECRSLLIEIGARGAKLKSGKEGWALISRAPLREDLKTLEQEEVQQ